MQDASTLSAVPNDLATCQQMIGELLATIGQLRVALDKQNAHIDYLVRMTFGRRSERIEGPTLFDAFSPPEPPTRAAEPEPEATVVVKRKGHGRRKRPALLPCEREVLDVTEAEKACPCCGEQRVKIGADVSSRLDYRPACLFRRELERLTYICRHCEQKGENIQVEPRPRR
jgi:transposase